MIDLVRRAHDHNWEMDPITRSLLDTDFYKLLMLQFIWKNFPRTRATPLKPSPPRSISRTSPSREMC